MNWKVLLIIALIASAIIGYKFVQTRDGHGLKEVKNESVFVVSESSVPEKFSQARNTDHQQIQSNPLATKDNEVEQMHIGRNLDANDLNASSGETFEARHIGELAFVDDEASPEMGFVEETFGSPQDTSIATWAVQLDKEVNIGALITVEQYFESHASQNDSLQEMQFGEYLPIPDEID